jgi:general secretion pathway protein H
MFAAGKDKFMNTAQDRGFTVLEILLVLLVIVLAMAITYPSLSRGSSSIRLRASARDVLNTFRYARERAITEQTEMMVVVDKTNRELIMSDSLGDDEKTYNLPDDVNIDRMALSGEEISDESMIVRFLPNGSADAAEVTLKLDNGPQIDIVADPITGGARIVSGQGTNLR